VIGVRTYAVRSVGSHGSSEDNATLATKLDEHTSSSSGAVPCTKHIKLIKPLHLLKSKVQCRLVLGSASICDHAVETTLLSDNGLNGLLDAVLICDIAVLELKLSGEALEESGEVFCGLGNVEAEDAGGVVGEADLGDTETDTLVGTSDWSCLVSLRNSMRKCDELTGNDLAAQLDTPVMVGARKSAESCGRGGIGAVVAVLC
jgi:hypothetical protein